MVPSLLTESLPGGIKMGPLAPATGSAVGGCQMPIAIDMKVAVARIQAAGAALHRKPAFALDGKIQVAAGVLQAALRQAGAVFTQHSEVIHGLAEFIAADMFHSPWPARSES